MSMNEIIYRLADGTTTKNYSEAAAVGGYTIEYRPVAGNPIYYNANRVKAIREKKAQRG